MHSRSMVAERFRRLWEDPPYRTKVAFFLLLGVLAALLASRLEEDPRFWSETLKQLSIVFIMVAVLQLVWDFLGGEPVSKKLELVEQRMSKKLESVEHRISRLSDLLDEGLGIDRVWSTRREWQEDGDDGLSEWRRRVCQAKRVEVMSNTFWNNWFKEDGFVAAFCEALERPDVNVRLLLYDPASPAAHLRERDEEWEAVAHEMTLEITRTLGRIERVRRQQPGLGDRLELRLTTENIQVAQIIRADDRMLVALYLSGRSGGHSPTLQLTGPATKFFGTYHDQFELMWERARPLPPEQAERENRS